jgi:hypothetical protein
MVTRSPQTRAQSVQVGAARFHGATKILIRCQAWNLAGLRASVISTPLFETCNRTDPPLQRTLSTKLQPLSSCSLPDLRSGMQTETRWYHFIAYFFGGVRAAPD